MSMSNLNAVGCLYNAIIACFGHFILTDMSFYMDTNKHWLIRYFERIYLASLWASAQPNT